MVYQKYEDKDFAPWPIRVVAAHNTPLQTDWFPREDSLHHKTNRSERTEWVRHLSCKFFRAWFFGSPSSNCTEVDCAIL